MSTYEQQRAARVQRNSEVLKTLGLQNALNQPHLSKNDAPTTPTKRRKRVSSREENNEQTETNEQPEERRWSSRIQKQRATLKAGSPDPVLSYSDDEFKEPSPKKPRKMVPVSAPKGGVKVEDSDKGSGDPQSSKNLDADIPGLVSSCLGREVPRLGSWKESCFRALAPKHGVVKFNKYSGIAEFRNAIVLFMNIQSDKKVRGQFENKFWKDDKGDWNVDYFASNKHHQETPVIVRLRNRSDPIVLFVRPVEGGSAGEAYYFAGRLELHSEDLDINPMMFQLKLIDGTKLEKDGDAILKELVFGE